MFLPTAEWAASTCDGSSCLMTCAITGALGSEPRCTRASEVRQRILLKPSLCGTSALISDLFFTWRVGGRAHFLALSIAPATELSAPRMSACTLLPSPASCLAAVMALRVAGASWPSRCSRKTSGPEARRE